MVVNPSIIRFALLFFPIGVAYELMFGGDVFRWVFPFLMLLVYFISSAYRIYFEGDEFRIVSFWTNKIWICRKDQLIVKEGWIYPCYLKVIIPGVKEFYLIFFLYSKSDLIDLVKCIEN
jgi:hypothetical protein